MEKLILTLLGFFVLSLCAAAQTATNVPGVTLSGDPANPLITNHSGKQVIAAMVVMTVADKTTRVIQRLFTKTANQLPDGGSELVGEYARNLPHSSVVGATVRAVIFADGEFRGEDSDWFVGGTEMRLQTMRRIWQMAKDGNWEGLKAKVNLADDNNIFGVEVAERLLNEKSKNGADAAVKSNEFVGNLPASTWKGKALLNWLRTTPVIQAVADWFTPLIAHAQSGPFCCTQPYPQGTSIDAWHPDQWHYTCNTWPGSSYPCPDPGGNISMPAPVSIPRRRQLLKPRQPRPWKKPI